MALDFSYPANKYDLYNKYRQDLPGMREMNSPVRQIANSMVGDGGNNRQQQEQQIGLPSTDPNPALRPGYTPPGVNVQYKAPVSDQIAQNMLDVGPGQLTDQQKATNQFKDRALNQADTKIANANTINEGKLANSDARTKIYDFKSQNPGMKPIFVKGGTVHLYNPITGETKDSGVDTGTLSDQDKIDLEQTGKETLAGVNNTARADLAGVNNDAKMSLSDLAAKHAKELEDFKSGLNTGTTSTQTFKDSTGASATKTTTTKPNSAASTMPPVSQRVVGKTKYTFPDGRNAIWSDKGWAVQAAGAK